MILPLIYDTRYQVFAIIVPPEKHVSFAAIGSCMNATGKIHPLSRQLFLEVSAAKKVGDSAQAFILRRRCRTVFLLDLLEDFLAVDGNTARCLDADLNVTAVGIDDLDHDVVTDANGFSGFACKYQHRLALDNPVTGGIFLVFDNDLFAEVFVLVDEYRPDEIDR